MKLEIVSVECLEILFICLMATFFAVIGVPYLKGLCLEHLSLGKAETTHNLY